MGPSERPGPRSEVAERRLRLLHHPGRRRTSPRDRRASQPDPPARPSAPPPLPLLTEAWGYRPAATWRPKGSRRPGPSRSPARRVPCPSVARRARQSRGPCACLWACTKGSSGRAGPSRTPGRRGGGERLGNAGKPPSGIPPAQRRVPPPHLDVGPSRARRARRVRS